MVDGANFDTTLHLPSCRDRPSDIVLWGSTTAQRSDADLVLPRLSNEFQ